jgi:hypothetical protein
MRTCQCVWQTLGSPRRSTMGTTTVRAALSRCQSSGSPLRAWLTESTLARVMWYSHPCREWDTMEECGLSTSHCAWPAVGAGLMGTRGRPCTGAFLCSLSVFGDVVYMHVSTCQGFLQAHVCTVPAYIRRSSSEHVCSCPHAYYVYSLGMEGDS